MNTSVPDYAVGEEEAAKILGIAPNTLRKMRSQRGRPNDLPPIPYFKYSRKCVRYSVATLEAWKASHLVSNGAGSAA